MLRGTGNICLLGFRAVAVVLLINSIVHIEFKYKRKKTCLSTLHIGISRYCKKPKG